MYNQLLIKNIYDLDKTMASDLLEKYDYPWEVLPHIAEYIVKLGATLSEEEYEKKEDNVWIAKDAKIAPTACIHGPAIIGKNAEIRHCAFLRGNVIVGEGATVGNSTELKNVILFNSVQVPHYNYVGDSILGYKAHFGAGAITSNIKSDRSNVTITLKGEKIDTGRIKMGAMVGDYVEVGCNSVLNPGTIVGRNSNIYPLSMVRGYVEENSIYKKTGDIVIKE